MAPQDISQPFTAFGSDAPNTASFNSIMASLMSPPVTRTGLPLTTAGSSQLGSTSGSAVRTSNASSSPTTLSTIPTSSSSSPSVTPTSAAGGSSNASASASNAAASNAASNSNNGVAKSEDCHSISCSPGLQAAVAVPVVLGVLGILALLFFLARRRKRSDQPRDTAAVQSEKPKKKWTRHLRIFSFDAELIGGRFSSTNSLRSGRSTHHLNDSSTQQRENPSLNSVNHAAPSYRDAVGHATHPNMTQTGAGMAAGGLAAGGLAVATRARPMSMTSDPPPYEQADHRPQVTPATPTVIPADPFTDSHPVSPVDGASPFGDPSEDGSSTHTRPGISRNSSMRTGLYPDETSVIGGSEAGSIRQAQIGRHVSIASGGRTITNIRNSSSGSPKTDSFPAL